MEGDPSRGEGADEDQASLELDGFLAPEALTTVRPPLNWSESYVVTASDPRTK